jgi:hypothetical protein
MGAVSLVAGIFRLLINRKIHQRERLKIACRSSTPLARSRPFWQF